MASKSLNDLTPETKRRAEDFISSCKKYGIDILKTCKSGMHQYVGRRCNECAKLRAKLHYINNKEKYTEKNKLWVKNNKEKFDIYQSKWRAENKEKFKKYSEKYRSANYEKMKLATERWGLKNKQKKLDAYKNWAINNKPKVMARNRIREAKKKERIPKWFSELDAFVFIEAQDLAKIRESFTLFKWEVDHIVPLISKEVCGLHIANNFRVIPWLENRVKGNKRVPEWEIRNGF